MLRFKDKKKKGKRSTQPLQILRRYTGLPKSTRRLSAIGLLLIKLSTFAQRAVNCVIGDDVDLENPWVYIKKEKIEDNLDLYEDTSDFFSLAEEISAYPDQDLLVCLKKLREEPDGKDEFYICVTLEVKEVILNLLEVNQLKINNAVVLLLERYARYWDSLGSQKEILEETMINIRPLLAIEIECEFPIFKNRRIFSLSLAHPDNLHFTECLSSNRATRLVYRRRLPVSVQVAPLVTVVSNQTMELCQKHAYTQTNHKFKLKELSFLMYKKLLFFLNERMSLLSDCILSNAHINLFANDYKLLENKHIAVTFHKQTPLKYFRDVKYSRNKYISALVWHPTISGLVATAYTHFSRHLASKEKPKFKRLEFMDNVVLIWCYSFCLKPKLILHSDREIMSLCFCPYNINILIGGCTNGQIVIWDLTNKLEQVETPELMLTPLEERHRFIIHSHTSWILHCNDAINIKPTAVSDLVTGHKNAVTSISWISSNFECTKNGQIIQTREPNKPFTGGQFITSSQDGLIYFWDFETTHKMDINKRKSYKLNLPLFYDVSPFRKLNSAMIPIFKIIIASPFSFPFPLTNLMIANQRFTYKVINPETTKDLFKRTYYKAIKSDYPKKFTNKLTLISNIGGLFTCTWTGNEYEQGNVINNANAENITFFNTVHDSPIHTCMVNPVDNNILLTVGGKMFAIWNCELDRKPLLWRKNYLRYNSGLWSVNNIGLLIMFRVDSKIELWDIFFDTKSPSRIIHHAGTPTVDTFFDSRSYHVTKETYFKSDECCNMVLTSLMSKEQGRLSKNKQNSSFLQEFQNSVITRRRSFQKWVNEWKERYIQPDAKPLEVNDQKEVETDITVIPEQKTVIKHDERWKKNDYEKKLLSMIVEHNKLDPVKIEKSKHLVMKEVEEKNKFQNKLKQFLGNSKQIFENKKKILLESDTIEKRKKSYYFYGKDTLIYKEIKKMYIQSYYETEKDILAQLQHRFLRDHMSLTDLIEKRRLVRKNDKDEEILEVVDSYSIN